MMLPVMPESNDTTLFTGSLLLAAPSMRDPNFSRTVIFMAAHSADEGAFGYVLNRPLEQCVSDLLPDEELGALADVPIFVGGPVATDKLAFASLHWNRQKSTLRCRTHLSVSDAIDELSLGHEVRGFVGYSGWSEGQLEKEVEARSWIITPAPKTILTTNSPAALWSAVLEEMGPVYQIIAHVPEDVELN
jgi:putative transcriptional regulator